MVEFGGTTGLEGRNRPFEQVHVEVEADLLDLAALLLPQQLAGATTSTELKDLQVELIDRFGLLPDPTKNLFAITELKLKVRPFGIKKIEAGPAGGHILFDAEPRINPSHMVKLLQTKPKEFKLDGTDKLRFFSDLADPAKRIQQVSTVVRQITG